LIALRSKHPGRIAEPSMFKNLEPEQSPSKFSFRNDLKISFETFRCCDNGEIQFESNFGEFAHKFSTGTQSIKE
jgi:hypothetical protein